MRNRWYVLVFLGLIIPVAANASACTKRILDHYSVGKIEGCECGAALKNVTATLPPSLKLIGVCDLALSNRNDKKIDLNQSKVTFDHYTDGYIPDGHLLLSGRAKLQGTLRVEEGPAGTYWFEPEPRLIRQDTALSSQLKIITFDKESHFKVLHPPKNLLGKNCFLVDVSMDVMDIHVFIGDGDENGTFPVDFSLKDVHNYRACP
jgi:hypothetical protein